MGSGIRRSTLTFSDAGKEAGFVAICAPRLVENFSYCLMVIAMVALIGVAIIIFLALPIVKSSSFGRDLWLINLVSLVSMTVISLLLLVVFRSPCMLHRIGFVSREVIILSFVLLSIMQIVFGNPYRLARLLGDDVAEWYANTFHICSIYWNTSSVLMMLACLFAGSHLVLPVRWIVLVSSQVVVVLAFGTTTLTLRRAVDNTEPTVVGLWDTFLLSVFVFLISLGKRQLEWNDRVMFATLLSEKTLRTEAEHRSQLQLQKHDTCRETEDAQSACTSKAGHVFVSLENQATQQQLNLLMSIGRQEQWLLGAEELCLSPKDSLLGAGGFGIVTTGHFHNSPVAMKILRKLREAPLSDLGNELRILRKLRHPNIVLFHGACLDQMRGDMVLVLEHVIGETLDKFVHCGGPSTAARCQVLGGICLALTYMHSRQPAIVHGDLKSGNILVEHRVVSPHAKLLDFGLARLLTTQAKPLGGTLRWTAPEVFANAVPHPAADVFSLGRLIYFIFNGKPPLAEREHKAIQQAAKSGEVLQLCWSEDPPPMLSTCRHLVEAATARSPEARPSVKEAHLEIMTWLPAAEQSPTPSGTGVAFWDQIQVLRAEVASGATKAAAEGLAAPPQAPAVVSSGTGQAVVMCHAGMQETPHLTRYQMILDCLTSWSVPLTACCTWHSLLASCQEACTDLAARPCENLCENWRQCKKCGCLHVYNSGDITQCGRCSGISGTAPSSDESPDKTKL